MLGLMEKTEKRVGVDLGPVRDRIDKHFNSNLDIDSLSAFSGYSPFYLIRLFKKQFRITPHQYQIRKRIERAKYLLAESALSVTDICFEIGFESMGTFSSRFQEITGWAPSVYRARVFAQREEPRRFIPHCYIHKYGLNYTKTQ